MNPGTLIPLPTFLLVIFSVGMGVAGQLLMKQGMLAHPELRLQFGALISALTQPYVLLGFACYGVASLSWLFVLSRVPLSVAYPMLSLGYAAIALLSWHYFGETLTTTKLLGIGAIFLGVVLLSRP